MARRTALIESGMIVAAVMLDFGLTEAAYAPRPPVHHLSMRLRGDAVRVAVTLPAELLAAFDDDADGRIDSPELSRHRESMIWHVRAGLMFLNQQRVKASVTRSALELVGSQSEAVGSDTVRVMVHMRWRQAPERVTVRWAHAANVPLRVQVTRWSGERWQEVSIRHAMLDARSSTVDFSTAIEK